MLPAYWLAVVLVLIRTFRSPSTPAMLKPPVATTVQNPPVPPPFSSSMFGAHAVRGAAAPGQDSIRPPPVPVPSDTPSPTATTVTAPETTLIPTARSFASGMPVAGVLG